MSFPRRIFIIKPPKAIRIAEEKRIQAEKAQVQGEENVGFEE